MLVYSVIILWLNNSALARELRPHFFRNVVMGVVILFLAFFCIITAISSLSS